MSNTKDEPIEDVATESPAATSTSNEHQLSVTTANHELSMQVGGAINRLNLFDEKDLIAAENFLTKIMRSEKGGIKNVNDGLAVLMRCQDLALPFGTCLEHIHVINGKTGIDIHIVKALLSKAACTWRCIKDYQAQYECTDGINVYCDTQLPAYCIRCKSKSEAESKRQADKEDDNVYVWPVKYYSDFNGNKYKDYQLSSKTHKVITTKAEAIALLKDNIIGVYRIPAIPIDFVTEYELRRVINGKEVTAIGRFSYTEAIAADFFEKDTYKKYARILIGHRAFTYGARDIASDILLGANETTELKLYSKVPLSVEDTTYVEL
ncbi:MAG: recombinase [crAssphage sp. isolate ctbg_1]|uniref:Recombinase n=1 Tax=crAssphage sp. isolate ctbg_1 TaxID=2989854 RepID=A0A345MT44_9CAUD|nr:MAG: recombinase [crAssphage sp. isolate ctbg_1]AXH74544.1 MAG: recombinase [crAssphage sp. isolate ctbg_1]